MHCDLESFMKIAPLAVQARPSIVQCVHNICCFPILRLDRGNRL